MNIYDFDGTIYNGDSSKDIILYGLRKCPSLTIKSLKKAKQLNKDYKVGLVQFERVKEELFSFIFKVKNTDEFINSFVSSHFRKIKPWYLSRRTDKDIIVSASYELWLNVFAQRLGINYVIGTRVDKDGKILGNNCKGEEKVLRIKESFANELISSCYSDSSTDIPILEMSKNSYVVEGNKIIPYKRKYKFKNNK